MTREPEIPATTAAKLVKVSTRRLQQLVAEGWIKKTAAGGYTVVGTIHGYIDYLKDEARRGMRSTAEAQLQTERAKILRLKREKLARTLMLVEEHQAIMDESCGIFRIGLGALPSRLSDIPEERRRIEDHCDQILNDVSDLFQKAADELEAQPQKRRNN
jgi:hypothetical protein